MIQWPDVAACGTAALKDSSQRQTTATSIKFIQKADDKR